MKPLFNIRRKAAALLALGCGFVSPAAWALGTASGTDVSNTASLTFSIGGVPQGTSSSNTTTFKVDNVVRVTVGEANNTATPVAPASTAQVTTFSVTNTGNTTHDYSLATANLATSTTLTLGATLYTDAFDATACAVFVESGATVGYQAGADTATSIGSLAADASRTVYAVCNVPAAQGNGTDAIVSLTATTANDTTCAAACVSTLQTAGADTPGAVDVVFGDAAGTDDIVRDGKGSARDAYEVSAAQLTISKTAVPICDPFNNNVNPKSIPGAVVRYEITIANAAGAGSSATLTTLSDTLLVTLAFDPDLLTGTPATCATSAVESAVGNGFKLSCVGGTRACATGPTPMFFTGAIDADAVSVVGQAFSVNGSLALPAGGTYTAGEIKPGESVTLRFNAVIQ